MHCSISAVVKTGSCSGEDSNTAKCKLSSNDDMTCLSSRNWITEEIREGVIDTLI